MIDTDKYEGHTPAPWDYESGEDIWAEDRLICRMSLSHSERPHYRATNADAQLIADAPLLLEEVKRLREAIADIADEMEQVVCTEYEQEIIEDLRKVIE